MRPRDLFNLNVATKAPKYPRSSWLTLSFSAVIFLLCAVPLWRAMNELEAAKEKHTVTAKQYKRNIDQAKKFANESAKPNEAINKALQQVKNQTNISWNGLFEVLEYATKRVSSGVTLVSMVPSNVTPTNAEATLSGIAVDSTLMLGYMSIIKNDPRVTKVELTTSQPDERSGASALRFKLDITWNPSMEIFGP